MARRTRCSDVGYVYHVLNRAVGRSILFGKAADHAAFWKTKVTTYTCDLVGNLDRVDLPNGVISKYLYDSLYRLDKLTQYAPDGTPSDLTNNPKLSEYDPQLLADGKWD